jgi:4'-phosphopantetheinyl transferase
MDKDDPHATLWLVQLDELTMQQATALTEDADHARAAAYHRKCDRERALKGRAVLRVAAAQAMACAVTSVQIPNIAHQRPTVVNKPNAPWLSLSHSGAYILAATCPCPIGVDIEQNTRDIDISGLAQSVLSPEETKRLATPIGPTTFFDLWTQKEAYVKAQGMGLSIAPDSFTLPERGGAIGSYHIAPLSAADGYSAAICVKAARFSHRFHTLQV